MLLSGDPRVDEATATAQRLTQKRIFEQQEAQLRHLQQRQQQQLQQDLIPSQHLTSLPAAPTSMGFDTFNDPPAAPSPVDLPSNVMDLFSGSAGMRSGSGSVSDGDAYGNPMMTESLDGIMGSSPTAAIEPHLHQYQHQVQHMPPQQPKPYHGQGQRQHQGAPLAYNGPGSGVPSPPLPPAQPPAAFMTQLSKPPVAMTAAPSEVLYPRECPRVARFMESIGAGWLRERFAEEDIDGDLLATMNYSDLLDMDVPDGACRAIARAVQNGGV